MVVVVAAADSEAAVFAVRSSFAMGAGGSGRGPVFAAAAPSSRDRRFRLSTGIRSVTGRTIIHWIIRY
jgi:hypothetical protein